MGLVLVFQLCLCVLRGPAHEAAGWCQQPAWIWSGLQSLSADEETGLLNHLGSQPCCLVTQVVDICSGLSSSFCSPAQEELALCPPRDVGAPVGGLDSVENWLAYGRVLNESEVVLCIWFFKLNFTFFRRFLLLEIFSHLRSNHFPPQLVCGVLHLWPIVWWSHGRWWICPSLLVSGFRISQTPGWLYPTFILQWFFCVRESIMLLAPGATPSPEDNTRLA